MKYEHYQNRDTHLVAVDCVIFGYKEPKLKLLIFKRNAEPEKGKWSLPGGWVNNDETLEAAAERVLKNLTGVKDVFMDQVAAFSKPERDPGDRVISMAFYALVDYEKHNDQLLKKYDAEWADLEDLPPLIFDHQTILYHAQRKLRHKASHEIIGRNLLPDRFTMAQLRKLYNCIFNEEFDPGNFRKKVLASDQLIRTDSKDETGSKRGAFYYEFKKPLEEKGMNQIKFPKR